MGIQYDGVRRTYPGTGYRGEQTEERGTREDCVVLQNGGVDRHDHYLWL